MYFKRKIDYELDEWLKGDKKNPCLIVGIRQCGKTETVREFARRNSLNIIELNFWTHKEYSLDFSNDLEVDSIISNISLRFPDKKIEPNNTLLFFDEIQDCPRARLAFKNFSNDGRYKVIGSGSYLGVNGYIIGDTTPTPVGYEEIFEMQTMDFEEFLWANGYSQNQIDVLIKCFEYKNPIPQNMHLLFKKLFLTYVSIGGFPKVVKKYIQTKKIIDAYRVLNDTVFEMKADFGRREDKLGNPVFKPSEVARIQNVFDLIPTFLSKENKRFIVSKISTGRQYDKNDAIEFLRQAHIVSKVHNLETPSLPLAGQKIESQFKLFPNDIGVITSMYGVNTVKAIINEELGQGKGALYEAIVFDSLIKAGIDVYYFAKESGLKIDFVISYNGSSTLIETRTKNGNSKASRTVMNDSKLYDKTKLIKIGDYNVSEEGNVIKVPYYLIFALGKIKYDF